MALLNKKVQAVAQFDTLPLQKNLGRALFTAILDGFPIALPFFSPGE